MIATLIFDMNDPKDAARHRRANAAKDMAEMLIDFGAWLSRRAPYGVKDTETAVVRDHFFAMMRDREIWPEDVE